MKAKLVREGLDNNQYGSVSHKGLNSPGYTEYLREIAEEVEKILPNLYSGDLDMSGIYDVNSGDECDQSYFISWMQEDPEDLNFATRYAWGEFSSTVGKKLAKLIKQRTKI